MLERLRRGTPEARAEFFRLYAPRAREILFLQGMCDDVDDGVQEVFVKVFRTTLPREETFLGWFYQVILNTGRDLGRRRKRSLQLVRRLSDVAQPAVAPAPEPPSGDRPLRDALQALAPEFREVVALRFFAEERELNLCAHRTAFRWKIDEPQIQRANLSRVRYTRVCPAIG